MKEKILKIIFSCKNHEQLLLVNRWIDRLSFEHGDGLSDYGIKYYYKEIVLEMRNYLDRIII